MKKYLLTMHCLLTVMAGLHARIKLKHGVSKITNIPDTEIMVRGELGLHRRKSHAFGNNFFVKHRGSYQKKPFEFPPSEFTSGNEKNSTIPLHIPDLPEFEEYGDSESKVSLKIFGKGYRFSATGSRGVELGKEEINSLRWGAFAGIGFAQTVFHLNVLKSWFLSEFRPESTLDGLSKYLSFFLTPVLWFLSFNLEDGINSPLFYF